MEQLSMDDLLYQFDEDLAKWEDISGHFEICTVRAYIPKDALSPLEQWQMRWEDPERKRREKLWLDHCVAIWHQVGFAENAWQIACRKLESYRDEGKPVEMQLTRRKHGIDFIPDRVAEYL
jgi:hypothetical protein